MSTGDVRVLIDRLNPTCRAALEQAASLCVSQTHYNVELEHLLAAVLDSPGADVERILHYYDLEPGDLLRSLNQSIETFDRGNHRTPAFAPHVVQALREGWNVSTLRLDDNSIRTGALLLGTFENDDLRRALLESCPELAKIPRESLRDNLAELVHGSVESGDTGGATESAANPSRPSSDTALGRYTIDLTAEARDGRIDPIRGRGQEIRQVIDILTRRRQNNPILVGEAGVGKTAVVEGFARQVARGEIPSPLRHIAVCTLDLGLLKAGAGVRGEFEDRLKSVLNEVEQSEHPVILFIDEAHTLIGAGGSEGQGDAANLLKPALARGDVRTIAATTWSEYKRYFEKDPALARRFQVVKVEEPDEDSATEMLRGIGRNLERHHGVNILDEAIRDAVRLSARYLTERRLPDKAISVLDTACARVALAQDAKPARLEDLEHRLEAIALERERLEREAAAGTEHAERLAALSEQTTAIEAEHDDLGNWWRRESELIASIRAAELEAAGSEGDDAGKLAKKLADLKSECDLLQGDEPLVPLCVDSRVVAAVIAGWTGIPVGKMLSDDLEAVRQLATRLQERVVGQEEALDMICRRVSTSKAGLEDPSKPKAVFLLAGPTGVGKTETALALANALYGGERNLVTVNMSEFQEAHSVATLKGAPPGYVGYGAGGVLTEAVRRRPHCVVLLDEIEKAHDDVLELFYQVFDKGLLEDGEGVPVDFKNCVILLTSNIGADVIHKATDGSKRPEYRALREGLDVALEQRFRPAFLGRLVTVPYYPLDERHLEQIVRLKLSSVQRRFRESHGCDLAFDDGVPAAVAAECDVSHSGARNIDYILTQSLLPSLSHRVLERMATNAGLEDMRISLDDVVGTAQTRA